MFTKIKKVKNSYSHAMLSNFRFMTSRLLEMKANLERAQSNIDIAMEVIAFEVDFDLTRYNERLTKIGLTLTFFEMVLFPPQVIGVIMGMNVAVPD